MYRLPSIIENLMETLAHIYETSGERELLKVVVNANSEIQEGKEINEWGNGRDGHLVILTIPDQLFFEILDNLPALEKELCSGLNRVNTTIDDEYICKVLIGKEKTVHPEWRLNSGLLIDRTHPISKTTQNRIWKDEMFRLFISHKSEEKENVSLLKKELSHFGIDCFVAHEDIEPTREWAEEIESALFSMDACVAIMTEKYHDSTWTDHEIGCAYGRNVPVIPVRMGTDPYGLIARFQAISSNWKDLPIKLMQILLKHSKVIDTYINAISKCANFEEANSLSKLFPHIKSISSEQINKLIYVWQTNSQAKDSFGFNGKKPYLFGPGIAHYISKWDSERFLDEKTILDYIDTHNFSGNERNSL